MTTIIVTAPATPVADEIRGAQEARHPSPPRVVRTATPDAPGRRHWWSPRWRPVAADVRLPYRADDLDIRMQALRSYTWTGLGMR